MNGVAFTDWHHCYDDGWQGVIVPEAFAHPAKFAYGLITRIIRHGVDQGYWQRGDTIGDCFGGVGLGGIVAAYYGLQWRGVELEQRFIDLAQQNFALHRPRWAAGDDPEPVIIHGDSRRFADLVGSVAGVVSSPPYSECPVPASVSQPGGRQGVRSSYKAAGAEAEDFYGTSPGQIGSLKAGDLAAVITSPPYAESIQGVHSERETASESTAKRRTQGGSLGQSQRHGGYGASEGNIGNLKEGKLAGVVSSPPYADGMGHGGNKPTEIDLAKGVDCQINGYGSSPGNIGNLKEGKLNGAVTSPPFSEPGSQPIGKCPSSPVRSKLKSLGLDDKTEYGHAIGQIGNERGETYWQAMQQVYQQMHLALKPGSVAAIVVKDYVKNKQRVPLCDDTCALLESVGFTVFERTRCWLVKESRQPDLFGGEKVQTKSRKSFFRRLAEKNGSPPIDYEEVIWCRVTKGRPCLTG